MAEHGRYRQCKLRCANSWQVAWIEEHGAHVGYKVQLLPKQNLWEVVEVFDPPLDRDQVKEMEANYRAGMPSTRDTYKDKRKKASA